jgi:hypothetical protein
MRGGRRLCVHRSRVAYRCAHGVKIVDKISSCHKKTLGSNSERVPQEELGKEVPQPLGLCI